MYRRQESTGYSPYYLMFGHEPRLPVDLVFGLEPVDSVLNQSLSKYVQDLRERLKSAYEIASRNVKIAQGRQRKHYDMKARSAVLRSGDRVLVKVVAFEGKHKLADKWEQDPYVVIDQPVADIPVFTVTKENGEGKSRTLHRNLLLPIGSVPLLNPTDKPVPKPRRLTLRKCENFMSESTHKINERDAETSSESEYEVEVRERSPQTADGTHPVVGQIPLQAGDDQSLSEDFQSPEVEEDALLSVSDADTSDTAAVDDEISEEDSFVDEDADQMPGGQEPDTGIAVDQDLQPETELRRSSRERKLPERFRSGDYVMAQQHKFSDWEKRATFLKEIVDSGLLTDRKQDVSDAFLKLILDNG